MASFTSMGEPPFAYDPTGKPTKSILKHKARLSGNTASWFSTFNSKLTAASLSFPPDNSVADSSVAAAKAANDSANHLASSVSQQQQQQRSSLGLLNFRKLIGTLPSNGSNGLSDALSQSPSDKTIDKDELAPEELKRVRFSVKKLTTEYYPYHNQSTSKDDDKDEKETADQENETAEPLEQDVKSKDVAPKLSNDLFDIYSTACKDKEEPLFSPFVACLNSHQRLASLTRVDLSNQPLNRRIIEPIADVIGLGVGLEYLNLNNCNLEDDALKILLHALLLNDTLRNLNLANNRKLKANGFKYVAIFIKESSKLEYLDLSFTNPEKKGIQYLAQSLGSHSKPGHTASLKSLIMDGCALKPPFLEALASGVRKSTSIRRLSLRHNKINNQGALWLGVMLRDYDDQDSDKGLEELDVTSNDIRAGIQYIAQALRRNKSLQKISLCDCKIDSKGCALIGEAMKYNQSLESLDVSQNSLCKPTSEGITAIKHALYTNTSLKSFNLSSSGLGTEAAVALAECIPENRCLTRLDLSNNLDIDLAGLMALSASMRINQTLCFLDISIPTNDREMAKIQRDIVAACTRNAQARASPGSPSMQRTSSSSSLDPNTTKTTTQATARLTLQERLAAVTRGKSTSPSLRSPSSISERPKSPEHNTQRVLVDAKVLESVSNQIGLFEEMLQAESSQRDELMDEDLKPNEAIVQVHEQCQVSQSNISNFVQTVTDANQLSQLLAINDRLTSALARYEELFATKDKKPEREANVSEPVSTEWADGADNELLSSSFQIGDINDEDEDEDDLVPLSRPAMEMETKNLEELRKEKDIEEGIAFRQNKP